MWETRKEKVSSTGRARARAQACEQCGRDVHPECLAADGVEERERTEFVVRYVVRVATVARLEDLFPQPLLQMGMLGKEVEDLRKHVRCRVHGRERHGSARRSAKDVSVSDRRPIQEKVPYTICPMSSSSDNRSSAVASVFALTAPEDMKPSALDVL